MSTSYTRLTKAIIEELEKIVGPRNLITDSEKMEHYSHDETSVEEYGHMPEVVLTPLTVEQVAAIMKLASRHVIPVTPRGAGSGLSGGAIPFFP
jgi:glycolate oxidase